MTPKLVVATRNPGKVREFARLLAGLPWEVIGLDEAGCSAELIENADTYEANAVMKAEQAAAATGLPALADDSGIEVDALNGWPGAHSARWMGPGRTDAERLHGLLDEVERRSPDDRRARYVAVLAFAQPGETTVTGRGECTGVLVEPDGEGGFGYDPAFRSDDLGITFGTATQQQKDGVSHRARALRDLVSRGALDPPAAPRQLG